MQNPNDQYGRMYGRYLKQPPQDELKTHYENMLKLKEEKEKEEQGQQESKIKIEIIEEEPKEEN